jgi:dTMP kinase
MSNGRPGILIAVEGIDGAGKTTQVDRLCDILSRVGETVVRSKEPTNGPHGRRLRESAQTGRLDAHEELQAFIADRREHVRNVIKPALSRGETVVLDRYFYSTIAYQGERTGHHPCELYQDMREFPTPDITFLIDVSPEIGLHRVSGRGDIPNEFERAAALTTIRGLFLQLLECAPEIHVINGFPDIESVQQEIIHKLVDVLKPKRCYKSWDCDELYCSYRTTGECTWPAERAKLLQQPAQSIRG